MAIANVSLGTVPSPSTAMTNARLWQLLGVTPAYNLGTGSKTLVAQINAALYDISVGTTVLPRTITTINGQPKTLTGGELTLRLSDIPDAASNIYLQANFPTNSVVSAGLAATNTAIITANLAMKTYVDARVTANLAANVVETVTASLNSGNLLAPINANITTLTSNVSTLSSNAVTQAVQVNAINANLGAFQTYSNTIVANLGAFQIYANATFSGSTYGNATVAAYLPTDPTWTGYLTEANANAAVQTAGINNISTVLNLYQTYANSAIVATQVNLDAYQTYANANSATQATSINTINDNLTAANARIVFIDANIGTLVSNILNPLSADNATTKANVTAANINISSLQDGMTAANTRVASLDANVGGFAANISTLLSNAATQGSTLANLVANAATQATSINTMDANLGSVTTTVNGLLLSNAGIQATTLADLTANAVIQHGNIRYLDANLGTATTNIATGLTETNALRANITAANLVITNYVATNNSSINAYQTYANANVSGLATSVTALFSNAAIQNAQIVVMDANIGAYQTYANTASATLSANVGAFYTYANVAFTGATYSNANVAAYLPTNPTWTGYLTAANANAATQATSINTINANLGLHQTVVNASLASINANLGSYQTFANANAVSQSTSIDTITTGLAAYQAFANANAVAQTTSINAITANLAAYQTYANLTFGAGSFGNANVFGYLNSYNGNLVANNVSVTNQVSAKKLATTDGVFWANGAPYQSPGGPVAMAYNSDKQNLATGATVLKYTTTTVNTSTYYNTSTGLFMPLVAGYYQVNVTMSPELVSGAPEAIFQLGLYKNGTIIAISPTCTVTSTTPILSNNNISALVYLNGTTDDLGVAYLSTIVSGTWRTAINSVTNYFQAVWIRA
jgi:hypothetical protein